MKFPNLEAALKVFDNDLCRREILWMKVRSTSDVDKAGAADDMALQRVQDAFYEDTQDRNTLASCRHADLNYLRGLCDD